jgi:hypothetical protein
MTFPFWNSTLRVDASYRKKRNLAGGGKATPNATSGQARLDTIDPHRGEWPVLPATGSEPAFHPLGRVVFRLRINRA